MRKVSHIQLHSPVFIPGGPGNLSSTIAITTLKSDKHPHDMRQAPEGVLVYIGSVEAFIPNSNIQVMILAPEPKAPAAPKAK